MALPKNAKYLDLQQTGCTVFFVERKTRFKLCNKRKESRVENGYGGILNLCLILM